MANEFKIKNGFFSEGSSNITGSFLVTGNVGIGITTPLTKLHVSIDDNAWSGNTIIENINSGTSAQAAIAFKTANNGSNTFSISQINNGGSAVLYNAANAGMNFYTNALLRMTIAAGGNIGIGTTNPIWQFVVSKNGAAGLEIDPDNGTAGRIGIYAYNRSTSAYLPITFEASSYNLGGGNVGIGTTSPSSKLHLEGTTTLLTITDTTYSRTSQIGYIDNANLYFANDGSSNTYIGRYNSVFLAYGGGNVGIRTTTPSFPLEVSGSIVSSGGGTFGTGGTYGFGFTGTSLTGDGVAGYVAVNTGGSEKMRVTISGNVGIGTSTPDASAILDLTSTTKGFLLPRMNDAEMNTISSPSEGLMIWETDSKSVSVYDGGSWRRLMFA
jgi:hypothetical protein